MVTVYIVKVHVDLVSTEYMHGKVYEGGHCRSLDLLAVIYF